MIKRFRMIPGNHSGTSGLILLTELKMMERSVNTKASQVITPTEKSSLVIALVRTNGRLNPKKANLELAYNYRNKLRKYGYPNVPSLRTDALASRSGVKQSPSNEVRTLYPGDCFAPSRKPHRRLAKTSSISIHVMLRLLGEK